MCIKAGDLASSACSWIVHQDWCFRVVEEFYRQGEEEKALGLPISPLCDRTKHRTEYPKSQMGFIEFVSLPLFAEMRAFDHQEEGQMQELIVSMTANKAQWEALSAESDSGTWHMPVHISEYGRESQDLSDTKSATQGPDRKRGERYRRRRWRSIVGPISAQPPIPIVESRARRSRSRKASNETSLGDVMTSSSWGEDDTESGVWLDPAGDYLRMGEVESSSQLAGSDEDYLSDAESRSTSSAVWWTHVSASSGLSLDRSPPDGPVGSAARFNAKLKMKRDLALSPSARVAPVGDVPSNAEMLDIIKRRASVLTPNLS
eukprot:Protomagalhaensia_sp_Gyna_25__5549@NODE_755_length_2687_cov_148_141239_g593_i0_p1_GENE_NODE_755_length_2687_cov_148_141239_g593_i0NODE_755_length_2687_cov_148_141239_g593_i0_p1_ORF_typecomplete_len328_score50_88PDEase_I/PF00233_19/1_8e25_NODE_755_length_2687_cov_148_141239_g593_i033986